MAKPKVSISDKTIYRCPEAKLTPLNHKTISINKIKLFKAVVLEVSS